MNTVPFFWKSSTRVSPTSSANVPALLPPKMPTPAWTPSSGVLRTRRTSQPNTLPPAFQNPMPWMRLFALPTPLPSTVTSRNSTFAAFSAVNTGLFGPLVVNLVASVAGALITHEARPAPRILTFLPFTVTCSVYVPAATLIVPLGIAAVTASCTFANAL